MLVFGRMAIQGFGFRSRPHQQSRHPHRRVDYNARKRWPNTLNRPSLSDADRPAAKADKLAADYKRVADTQARAKKPTCPSLKSISSSATKALPNTALPSAKAWGSVTLVGGSKYRRFGRILARSILKSPRRQTRRDRDYRTAKPN